MYSTKETFQDSFVSRIKKHKTHPTFILIDKKTRGIVDKVIGKIQL